MLNEAISKMPEAFESNVLLRGQEYFQKGQVLNIRLSEGLLKGRVKGSSSQIYDVHMDLKIWPAKPAHCTCNKPTNCKHAAACLFALRDRDQLSQSKNLDNRLDRKLDIWLKNLRVQEENTIKKHEPTHHLVYLIDLKLKGFEHKVAIELALAKILKRGGYGKKNPVNNLSDSKKQHFIADDGEIVAQLMFKCGISNGFDVLTIRNTELLERIIATGRAFYKDNQTTPIQLGEQLTGTCQWVLSPDGTQSMQLMQGSNTIQALLIDDCWYFDINQPILGRLSTRYPVPQLKHLLEAPPITIEQGELLAKKMRTTHTDFPAPKVFSNKILMEIPPVPVITFGAMGSEADQDSWFDEQTDCSIVFTAKIAFDYGGVLIGFHEKLDKVMRALDKDLLISIRDSSFEEKKIEELFHVVHLRATRPLENAQWQLKKDELFILEEVKGFTDLEFLYSQVIPDLKNLGWRIEFASDLYQEIVHEEDIEWFSELHDSTNDFFSYQLGILIEGKAVSIVPLVVKLIQRYTVDELDQIADHQMVKLPLGSGRVLQVQLGRIKPLIRLLLQLGFHQMDENHVLQINKYQFILMQEAELALLATQSRWRGADELRQGLRQLTQLTQIPEVPQPKGLRANLRDYQQLGLNWLQFIRATGFSGVLADDMGLGKTIQTLALLQCEKEQGRIKAPTLIIAPTSLVGNWLAEAKRFTPQLQVLVYHGTERHHDSFESYDLVISTYGLIQRDKEKFINQDYYYLILDEAQFIKNAKTKTTQIIQQLKATHRLCLTGTPLENHLGELWSLFYFLMPGLLGDARQFRLWFRTPIEKNGDTQRKELLARRVKPFILRRTKNEVAKELPPKTEMTRYIELSGPQRDLYEAIRMSMEKKVREAIAKQGLGKSHILLLDALLKLRQVCCDPRLLSLPQAAMAHGHSSKLEALMELLDNLVNEGRRVLIFSQFTSMLELIEQKLINHQYQYMKLTGQTQNRQSLVESFQQGTAPIFLISLKAGGTGLNLTRADTVIHYDPWWNPAVEDQATDRTHRIGQENPVFVYKLIASGTVEEAILGMQQRKRQLVEGILSSETSKSMVLTENDLEQFFMPLK